jgi:hypothetical protein
MLKNKVAPELLAQYRQKAEACRRLADLSLDDRRKAHWMEQATVWERLAAKATKRSQSVQLA